MLDHYQLVKMNVIYYDQSIIEEKSKNFKDVDKNLCDSTIYMKLPERIVYGLLRNYGKLSSINAQIIIEEAIECEIKYYEWSNSHQLTEVSFNNYLKLFMSTYYSLYMG
ncbi:hypothetical protein [Terrilactibacillus laevilacticus]|uniref:Uncharacterized protein n=1 Tax=Terrilactibacillus laevilacticus TaxID=1380157 RepID=A0ABW5PN28_9BACI|nr:hypothetical protein [Terrilactibacillus laevilacticus]